MYVCMYIFLIFFERHFKISKPQQQISTKAVYSDFWSSNVKAKLKKWTNMYGCMYV